jgi:DNA-binding Lrp family transcriptional regulator
MVPLLAFVDIFVDPTSRADDVAGALSRLSNVVELYEVKGEFDIVTLISASSIEEFHNILHNKILNIKGVRSEVSSVVINTDKGPLTINKENAAVPACSME